MDSIGLVLTNPKEVPVNPNADHITATYVHLPCVSSKQMPSQQQNYAFPMGTDVVCFFFWLLTNAQHRVRHGMLNL